MAEFGWEPGRLKSIDRFADICIRNKNDNDGFLAELGDEYHISENMGAVQAFRGLLAAIADEVEAEVFESAEKVALAGDGYTCSLCDKPIYEGEQDFKCCPFCGHPFADEDGED